MNKETYVVHLYGTWTRPGAVFNAGEYITSLRDRMQMLGLDLKASVSNTRRGTYDSILGTFELQGDVEATSESNALLVARRTLERTMGQIWCNPPTLTVE